MLAWPQSNIELASVWCGLFGLVLLVVLLSARVAALASAWATYRKYADKQTIIAEYGLKLGLTSYELGYLYDNRFADNELFAVILELAHRKAVKIELKGKNTTVHILPVSQAVLNEMPDAELLVYIDLRQKHGGRAAWRTLKSTLSETLGTQYEFEHTVRGQLMEKGYVNKAALLTTLNDRQMAVAVISFLSSVLIFSLPVYVLNQVVAARWANNSIPGYMELDQMFDNLLLIVVGLAGWAFLYMYANLVAYLYYRVAGVPIGATPYLRRNWPKIIGYRHYIRTVEANRLSADPNLLDPYMPVCIAFSLWPKPLKHMIQENH